MAFDLESPPAHALIEAILGRDAVALRGLLSKNPGLASARFAPADPRGGDRTVLPVATDWGGRLPNRARTVAPRVQAGGEVGVACTGPHAETALHWAASANNVVALDALLAAGADIEAHGGVFHGGTPLADAVGFGQWQAARHLVEHGASTTLWQAAALGLRSRIRDCFPDGAYPAQEEVNTGFWYACYGGQFNAALYILREGAELNCIRPQGRLTPLDAARLGAAKDLAQFLHTRGARSATSPHGRCHQPHGLSQQHGLFGTLACPYRDLHTVVVEPGQGQGPYASGQDAGVPEKQLRAPTSRNDPHP